MRNHLSVILFLFIITLSANSQTIIPEWFEKMPEAPRGTMYAVGYTGKYQNPSMARKAALYQALTNMAKQVQTHLIFEIEDIADGIFRLLNPTFDLSYEAVALLEVESGYTALDSSITTDGYFVLISYPPAKQAISANDQEWGARPGWTINLPSSSKYYYGIGIVSNYSSWVRAWRDADEYARFDLGKNIEVAARSVHTVQRDNRNVVESKIIRQSYDLTLKNSIIIARWYDKNGDTYYALCRQPQSVTPD
jgi:hypothetical protein